MRLHLPRLTFVGPILVLLLLLFTTGTAGAASNPHSGSLKNAAALPHQYTPAHISVSKLDMSGSGSHYLYVDDGTCPDSIDVYQTGSTLTHVGNYPNDGCTSTAYYGASSLATVMANKTHGPCLLLADSSGFVDSFVINSDGSLGAEVSHLQTASFGAPSNIVADVHANTAYETNPGFDLESYSIGSGCALTYLQSTNASSKFYISAVIINKDLVTTDLFGNTIDTYVLGSGGSMTLKNSVASQIISPDSLAVQVLNPTNNPTYRIFTGQATGSAPQVQGARFTRGGNLKFLPNSPLTDPNGLNGGGVTFDNALNLLIQGEQYTAPLANYSAGRNGFAFLSETPMAVAGEAPSTFAQLNKTLFVDMIYNGDLEACTLTRAGATNCASVAVLTSNTGVSAGIALL